MLKEGEIAKIIDNYKNSYIYKDFLKSRSYYEGHNDIEKLEFYYINSEGKAVKDNTKTNIKISHRFFTELVDQQTDYMFSNDEIVKSDIPELQEQLNNYFNDDFNAELKECIRCTAAEGSSFIYFYKKQDGLLKFVATDATTTVEVKAKNTSDKKDSVIYYYNELMNDNKVMTKIQVWNKDEVGYFQRIDGGKVEKDEDFKNNIQKHYYVIFDDDEKRIGENFKEIPFFRLDNNKKRKSNLWAVKDLIDDYDKINCGLSNNIEDFSDAYIAITGFNGDDPTELIQNFRTKKHIAAMDAESKIDIKTVDIPYQARESKLALDKENIYKFGMGFDSSQVGDGNITNVVIKSRYALLDLKCNKLESRLKQFLRKIVSVVLQEINDKCGTGYTQKDIYFEFDREIITNEADNATIDKTKAEEEQIRINTILSLQTLVSNEQVLEEVCDILDLDYSKVKAAADNAKKEQDPYNDLEKMLGGDVIEQETTGNGEVSS